MVNPFGIGWVVVSSEPSTGKPLHVDGPYDKRETARTVKRILDEDESNARHTVARQTYLMPPRETGK
jgi:hypothetical protein